MLNILLTILYTILIFGVIIFVHELGHFITARLTGVKVNEFALGMGPAIWKHQGKRTLYSLRIFPIGGFCAMEGEDGGPSEKETDGEGAEPPAEELPAKTAQAVEAGQEGKTGPREAPFYEKSVPKRILICAAGAAMNLLLGFVLTACTFIGQPYYTSAVVAVFSEDASTQASGLCVGDEIIRINGASIVSENDIPFEIIRDSDGVVDMVVVREGERVELPGVRFTVEETDGVKSPVLDFKVKAVDASFFTALNKAARQTYSTARNAIVSIGDLITGREMLTGKVGFKDLSGPVGVGQVVGQAAQVGFGSILNIAAFITISIGMFNLLPFPALDGGRIIFLLIEAIRRKPVNPKWEGYINMAGLMLLFLLMILVTFKDIFNLF